MSQLVAVKSKTGSATTAQQSRLASTNVTPCALSLSEISDYGYQLQHAMQEQQEQLKQLESWQTRLDEYRQLLVFFGCTHSHTLIFPHDSLHYTVSIQSHMSGVERELVLDFRLQGHTIRLCFNDMGPVIQYDYSETQLPDVLEYLKEWCQNLWNIGSPSAAMERPSSRSLLALLVPKSSEGDSTEDEECNEHAHWLRRLVRILHKLIPAQAHLTDESRMYTLLRQFQERMATHADDHSVMVKKREPNM